MPAPQFLNKNETFDAWELQRIKQFYARFLADLTAWLKPFFSYLMTITFVAVLFNIFKGLFSSPRLLTAPAKRLAIKNKKEDDKVKSDENDDKTTTSSSASTSRLTNEEEYLLVQSFYMSHKAKNKKKLPFEIVFYLLLVITNLLQKENLTLQMRKNLIDLYENILKDFSNNHTMTFSPQLPMYREPRNDYRPHVTNNNDNRLAPEFSNHSTIDKRNELKPQAPKFKPQTKYNPALDEKELAEKLRSKQNVELKPGEQIPQVEEYKVAPPAPQLSPYNPEFDPPAYDEEPAANPPPAYDVEPAAIENPVTAYYKNTTQSWQMTQVISKPVADIEIQPQPAPIPSAPAPNL